MERWLLSKGSLLPLCSAGVASCLLATAVLNGAGAFPGDVKLWNAGLWCLAIVLVPCSLFRLLVQDVLPWSKRIAPTAALTVAFLVLGAGLEDSVTRWNFRSRMAGRMEVVQLVQQNALPLEASGGEDYADFRLPSQYAHLSAGGRVRVSRNHGKPSVIFFVNEGDSDYTGFVYRPGDDKPRSDGIGDFLRVQPWAPNWYFVVRG